MRYKGFYVKITPDTDLHREDKDGNDICCKGFTVEIFADESEESYADSMKEKAADMAESAAHKMD